MRGSDPGRNCVFLCFFSARLFSVSQEVSSLPFPLLRGAQRQQRGQRRFGKLDARCGHHPFLDGRAARAMNGAYFMPCACALFFRSGGAYGCNGCQLLAATGMYCLTGRGWENDRRSPSWQKGAGCGSGAPRGAVRAGRATGCWTAKKGTRAGVAAPRRRARAPPGASGPDVRRPLLPRLRCR